LNQEQNRRTCSKAVVPDETTAGNLVATITMRFVLIAFRVTSAIVPNAKPFFAAHQMELVT
jgi:hypothetical protein